MGANRLLHSFSAVSMWADRFIIAQQGYINLIEAFNSLHITYLASAQIVANQQPRFQNRALESLYYPRHSDKSGNYKTFREPLISVALPG